jgi:hypothetical protein
MISDFEAGMLGGIAGLIVGFFVGCVFTAGLFLLGGY